jgi:uncharacterized protein (TIGR00645 family)
MTEARPKVVLERALFAARWLLAPVYVGLVFALIVLVGVFFASLVSDAARLMATPPERLPEAGILLALSLIDLSLAASLVIIVVLSGYENFVSRIETVDDDRRPKWMGTIDFSGLKMKLISSVIAISAIALLRSYLEIGDLPLHADVLSWQVIIQLTFVVSGLLLAMTDLVVARTQRHAPADAPRPDPGVN